MHTRRILSLTLVFVLITGMPTALRAQSSTPPSPVSFDAPIQVEDSWGTRAIRDSIGIAPYLVMTGGNVSDLLTTVAALNTGYLHEGNPFNSRNNTTPIIITKIIGTVSIAAVMYALNHLGHPKVARTIGYLDGALTFGVAAHNYSLIRSGR